MPFRPEHSLLKVEVPALHTIDTSSVENLFGMWSLFSKTSHAMEDGKRLENLSWRLWNRETFCCKPQYATSRSSRLRSSRIAEPISAASRQSTDIPVPELSSSLDSASSGSDVGDDESLIDGNDSFSTAACAAQAHSSTSRPRANSRRHFTTAEAKHITPSDLEKIVISIKETKTIKSMEASLPAHISSIPIVTEPEEEEEERDDVSLDEEETERETDDTTATPHQSTLSHTVLLESSSSTVGTEDSLKLSQVTSQDSSSTEMSGHSIVRGFIPGGAPSSYRSQTHLPVAQPTPILKHTPHFHSGAAKKKGAMFTIGTSSGEDESSLDSHMRIDSIPKSELAESLRHRGGIMKKTTSFKDEVMIARAAVHHSPVFESDDEDEEVSESAIDDDDDSDDWEDSDDNSGPSSMDGTLFQRVDSRPNLTSRRSLLTTMMHEPDRAKAMASAASRSTSAMRRSRFTSPSGPSLATTPEANVDVAQASGTRPQPIIMTTSNTHQQLAFSPRTTRRNMLSTELTESLRKNLLWERQHKSTGNLAALKRRHTAQDMKNLKEHPVPTYLDKAANVSSYNNDYFNAGLGEYHARGW